MSSNAYLSVRVRTARDLQTVCSSYLYGTSTLLLSFPNGQRYVQAVVETTGENEGHALFLALYQADRLASGLYGASAYSTLGEALADMDALRPPL